MPMVFQQIKGFTDARNGQKHVIGIKEDGIDSYGDYVHAGWQRQQQPHRIRIRVLSVTISAESSPSQLAALSHFDAQNTVDMVLRITVIM